MPDSASRARIYHTVRTAHLERSLELEPADLLYGRTRYDFDADVASAAASRSRLEQAGDLRTAWLLARRGYGVVEINEPIAIGTVRRSAMALAAVAVGDRLRRRRTRVVSYAIGNVPIDDLPVPGGRARLGRELNRRLAPLVWRRCDRVAFGTDAAQAAYLQSFGPAPARRLTSTIPAVPTACACLAGSTPARQVRRLLFLGDLSPRKGFDLVMAAWPSVRAASKDVQLVIVGRGAMAADAHALADRDDRVDFVEDPPRSVVHDQLRLASAVVLPSRPHRGWREQVGLPLVEGLAHGCTVVTTRETGIAGWLDQHGHVVLDLEDAESGRLADALLRAVDRPMDPAVVLASLPGSDGRLQADAWMFGA